MKAIKITKFGGPEVLQAVEQDVPSPEEGEVLIKVHAAGVNRPDIVQRLGKYPPPPGVTEIPGLEVAGEVVESKSDMFKKGDKVCALLAGGGYAEYAVAPAGQCLPVPDDMSMTEAAVLPETFFTVWNNLFVRGELKSGETALIHGGASGIGTTAIQMAKAAGTTVIVTAGSDDKCEKCVDLGADLAINYKTQDFVTEVKAFTEERGVDVILDMVGGDYVEKNIEIMATDARHVSIAFLNGKNAQLDIQKIMVKRLTFTGSTLRPRPVTEKAALAEGLKTHIWPHLESGKIRPVIFEIFSLDNAAAAHTELENGDHFGKIVLQVI